MSPLFLSITVLKVFFHSKMRNYCAETFFLLKNAKRIRCKTPRALPLQCLEPSPGILDPRRVQQPSSSSSLPPPWPSSSTSLSPFSMTIGPGAAAGTFSPPQSGTVFDPSNVGLPAVPTAESIPDGSATPHGHRSVRTTSGTPSAEHRGPRYSDDFGGEPGIGRRQSSGQSPGSSSNASSPGQRRTASWCPASGWPVSRPEDQAQAPRHTQSESAARPDPGAMRYGDMVSLRQTQSESADPSSRYGLFFQLTYFSHLFNINLSFTLKIFFFNSSKTVLK